MSAAEIQACRQGDLDAFRGVYDRTHPTIYRLLMRMAGEQDAADLMQQTYLNAYRALDRFDGRSRFETWLYRIAVNEALQFLRRRARRPAMPLEMDPVDRGPATGARVDAAELLQQALEQIDPELRSIFLLREVEGMSYAELADVLGVAEGTIGSRLNRARNQLQQRLQALGWEG